ncbi:MAG: 50S ribosomal protein L4 [Acholeplasmatales bacterium]|nr:50S ribosomal protein L4 [Acholeplasmatales bacterium]
MPTIALLNQSGEKIKDLNLSKEVFAVEFNQQVIYDVVNQQRAAMRQGTHDTKGRSEVRGGGRKPWRQKGTGRARQGSIRAPQWVGGGTVFGPTPRSYAFKLNKKVRALAMRNVLTYKLNENKMVAVDTIVLDSFKTKEFVKVLNNLKVEGKTMILVSPEELTETLNVSARNIEGVFVTPVDNASVYEILTFKNLVLTEAAVKYFEKELN